MTHPLVSHRHRFFEHESGPKIATNYLAPMFVLCSFTGTEQYMSKCKHLSLISYLLPHTSPDALPLETGLLRQAKTEISCYFTCLCHRFSETLAVRLGQTTQRERLARNWSVNKSMYTAQADNKTVQLQDYQCNKIRRNKAVFFYSCSVEYF